MRLQMGVEARARLDSVQVLRGVAAMAVFVFHLVVTLNRYSSLPVRAWVERGQAGVDLFFVISGFIMAYSIRSLSGWSDAASFLARRIWRIAPLLYVLTMVHLGFKAIYGHHLDYSRIVNCFTILPAMHSSARYQYALIQAWTLGYEMAFYLVVALVVATVPKWRIGVLFATLILAPLLIWPAILNPLGNSLTREFALGVGTYFLWNQGLISRRIAFVSAASAILVFAIPIAGVRWIHWGVPAALAFIAALAVPIGSGPLSKGALWLGNASYSTYLSHVIVFDALAPLLAPFMSLAVMGALLGCAGLLAAWWIHTRVEKPLLRMWRGQRVAEAEAQLTVGPYQASI